jgi:thiosulfate dehydrogenase [quinone] large subunit
MKPGKITSAELAALVLRLGIGVNLFAHGLVRFGKNFAGFEQWLLKTFAASPLPEPLVSLSAFVIPPLEFALGLLLILGVRTQWVLFVAGLEMCGLIFGMCLVQNWEIVGVQMTYLICIFLLLNSPHLCFASIDSFLTKNQGVSR